MSAEPEECLEDIAMAQWEEAVITVRGTVKSEGSTSVKTHPNQQLAHEGFCFVLLVELKAGALVRTEPTRPSLSCLQYDFICSRAAWCLPDEPFLRDPVIANPLGTC